jgi:hypothetical protein
MGKIIVLMLGCIALIAWMNLKIDTTREGDVLLWYTFFENRTYIKLWKNNKN